MENLSTYSRFVQRLRRRYANELHLLPAGVPTLATMQSCFEALRRAHVCADALRMLRQLVMVVIGAGWLVDCWLWAVQQA